MQKSNLQSKEFAHFKWQEPLLEAFSHSMFLLFSPPPPSPQPGTFCLETHINLPPKLSTSCYLNVERLQWPPLAQRKRLKFLAWNSKLPPSALFRFPPHFLQLLPYTITHFSNNRCSLVCAWSWKNGKLETEGRQPGWWGHSQLSCTWQAVRGSGASAPVLHSPSATPHLSTMWPLFSLNEHLFFQQAHIIICYRQALC